MKIHLEELSEGVNRFSFINSASELNLDEPEITYLTPVFTQLQVVKESETLFLTGSVSARVKMECARCLEYFQTDLQSEFELIFRKKRPMSANKSEVELSKEDLITFEYEGEIIDLHDRIRETVLLAIPIKPLCSQKCRGLCPICGQNLNEGECGCQQRLSSSRFSELCSLSLD
ncbi:MAG: hypothetical protein B1H40_01630 [Candidatus Latescibacteria bacterium 4484_181]|nr:MAG: hypothetical protein B1H40_01630 [Candidatus Latescibacteria bacterium 4484_181]RKY69123.1 MAG: DUF177 domain-containing protein [Candidatus Latescibacterota bacterium]RKY73139.1 MAG: DUF177 domain-containing protein [Candidatus Latescibacterota bacterium]HDN67641.1 DUF177 domain-containing protein [Bacillota bacterium]